MKNLVIIACVSILLISCKKEEIEPSVITVDKTYIYNIPDSSFYTRDLIGKENYVFNLSHNMYLDDNTKTVTNFLNSNQIIFDLPNIIKRYYTEQTSNGVNIYECYIYQKKTGLYYGSREIINKIFNLKIETYLIIDGVSTKTKTTYFGSKLSEKYLMPGYNDIYYYPLYVEGGTDLILFVDKNANIRLYGKTKKIEFIK